MNILFCMRQNAAYGALLNSCSYNTLAFEPKSFHLIVQLGGTYAIMGRESLDSTLLHKHTDSKVAYGRHTWPHAF